MMISPEFFLSQYENSSYLELLKVRNVLLQSITEFEKDFDQKDPIWDCRPGPDVHYQWNLEVLGKVCQMLKEAFNREYEMGEKSFSDFFEDMKNETDKNALHF